MPTSFIQKAITRTMLKSPKFRMYEIYDRISRVVEVEVKVAVDVEVEVGVKVEVDVMVEVVVEVEVDEGIEVEVALEVVVVGGLR